MAFLDVSVAGVPLIAFVVGGIVAIILWFGATSAEMGEQINTERGVAGAVLAVLVVLIVADLAFASGGPSASSTSPHPLTGTLTISATPAASCYSFAPAPFTLHCDTSSGSYHLVSTTNTTPGSQDGASATIGFLGKYSTSLFYVAATTTAANEVGLNLTLRRTDSQFLDPACKGECKASVSFQITGPQGWSIRSNVSSMNSALIPVLAQDPFGTYLEAWTDVAGQTTVGVENGQGLMSLASGGDQATARIALVMNQAALPRNVPLTTYQFTGTLTVTMQFILPPGSATPTPITWSIPLILNLQLVAS